MKSKLYFSLFILHFSFLTLLSSCEKPYLNDDASSGSPAGMTAGNLTLSVFQIEQTSFSEYTRTAPSAPITRTAPSEACTRLSFAIYSPDGTRVKQINQTSDMADFGHASFQLEEGTYRLAVVAHSSSGNPTMTNPAKIQFDNSDGYSDTFLYSEEVTIASEPVDLSLTLHRIVALCRFIITDDYPAGVVKMQFKYTGGSGAFNAYTSQGCVKSTQTVTYSIPSGEKQFDLYTFPYQNTECTIHITATALDAASNVLFERLFDVPLARNQITWYSGEFFNEEKVQSSAVELEVDTKWDSEVKLTY